MKSTRARTFFYVAVTAALLGALLPAPSALAASSVELLNPSDYSTPLTLSDKHDADDTYHLVAWVGEVPPNPLVEFEVSDASGTDVQTLTGERVGTDTWEADYPIPDAKIDGQFVVRAILYQNVLGTGGDEVARTQEVVTINGSDVPPPPPSETVEITSPNNGEELGFFTPAGKKASAIITGVASAGAAQVRALYTFSDPGTDPTWVECGSAAVGDEGAVRARCTLADDGPAARVRAVALVANQTAPPAAPVPAADQTGDAHRVVPYVQTPAAVTMDPETDEVKVAVCTPLTATVRDQNGEPMAAVNVDVHAEGPDDQLKFANQRDVADSFTAPDQAHATEPTAKCSPTDDAGTQGDHNVPAAADKKHIESASGTDNDGSFTFVLLSEAKGGTLIEVWADADGDDAQGTTEASGGAQLGWGTDPPEPPRQVLLDPQNSSAATGECKRMVAAARQGGEPLPSRDIDVHIKGPEGVAFCATEGSNAQSPDSGEHAGGYHSDGTGHAEGFTDSQGQFVFGVTSSTEGVTSVVVWLDNDADDEQDTAETEPATSGQIAWGGETKQIPTTLTIKYRKPAFKGVAKTSEAKCKKGRGVLLKRKKKGRDPTIGSTTTDTRGRYKIASAGAKGKYYAIVSKTTEVTEQGDTLVCQRDKSPTTRV